MGPASPGEPEDPDGPWRQNFFLLRSKGKITSQKDKKCPQELYKSCYSIFIHNRKC